MNAVFVEVITPVVQTVPAYQTAEQLQMTAVCVMVPGNPPGMRTVMEMDGAAQLHPRPVQRQAAMYGRAVILMIPVPVVKIQPLLLLMEVPAKMI